MEEELCKPMEGTAKQDSDMRLHHCINFKNLPDNTAMQVPQQVATELPVLPHL